MEKKIIQTDKAPAAIGPYSQAVRVGNLLFCSGQIPLDPVSKQVVGSDIQAQTRQVLKNVEGLLSGAGLTLNNVVKSTVFLSDMTNFKAFNEIYALSFPPDQAPPARSTVAVRELPMSVLVEVECIAVFPQ